MYTKAMLLHRWKDGGERERRSGTETPNYMERGRPEEFIIIIEGWRACYLYSH